MTTSPLIERQAPALISRDSRLRERVVTFVAIALGLMLLVSAALKVIEPSPPVWLRGLAGAFSPYVIMATIFAEIALGVLLVAGHRTREVHLLATVLFGIFAATAAALTVAGFHSCGCFGRITVAPLAMAVSDVTLAVFFLLTRTRPTKSALDRRFSWGASVLAMIAAGAVWVRTGQAGEKGLGGVDDLAVAEETIDLGRIPERTARQFSQTFRVTNPTDRVIELDRLDPSCTCTSVKPSTKRLEPGQSADITVDVNWTARRGPQHADIAMMAKGDSRLRWLTVSATVDAGLVASPSVINLGPVAPGQIIRRRVTIVATGDEPSATGSGIKEIVPSTGATRVRPVLNTGPELTYDIEIDTSELPVAIGPAEVDIRFMPNAADAAPAPVAIKYQRLGCVTSSVKSLRFKPGSAAPQTVRFDVLCDDVANKVRFDIVRAGGGKTGYEILSRRNILVGAHAATELTIRPDQGHADANEGVVSRLRCVVDAREVAGVDLVRF